MYKTLLKWYDTIPAFCRSFVIPLFLFSITSFAEAQTYVPPRYGYIGDKGNFLDQQSEITLNETISAFYKETGFRIFIVSTSQQSCNYSDGDAQFILEAYTKDSTDKSMLLYICETENGRSYFQHYQGKGWTYKLDEGFFMNLNQIIIQRYNARYLTGDGFIVAVEMIKDVQRNDTDVNFDEIKESLINAESPQNTTQSGSSNGESFGKTEEEDLALRVFVFILFSIILGIGAVYAIRTKGKAAWFLFIFMTPFWLVFYTIALGEFGWIMIIVYIGGFIGGRILVANNNWWFEHRTILRNSGAFAPPPQILAETRRRVSRKRFEGRGSGGSWEQDYE